MYEQVANPNPSAQYYGVQGAMPLQPNWNVRMTPGVTGYSTRGQFSPMTDGSDSSHRASAENTSPSGFMGARIHPGGASTAPVIRSRNGPGQNGPGQNQQVGTGGPLPGSGNDDGDIIEIPKAQQTLYNGEPMGMTPMFAETPSWLTDNTTVQMPIYHRKSSDGLTLRLMVEALSGHGVRFDDETQDPLDPSPGRDRTGFDGSGGAGPSTSGQTVPGGSGMGANGITANTIPEDNNQVNAVASSSSSSSTAPSSGMPSIQQSPFGTLLIPSDSSVRAQVTNAIRLRRSTTVEPHWNKAPKILVVEDDVVYRQLSSKFLEKFGCVTETVENAQGAIEKMNRTKYDLVLMDIFFGPSMDG
jgi:osomolarity two-component system response regulator SKN7